MKHIFIYLTAATVLAMSCTKESRYGDVDDNKGKEIRFETGVLNAEFQTRVTAVTLDNIGSFQVMTTTGSEGTETLVWSVIATKDESASSGNVYQTGKYWPDSDPSYHFYASNESISLESGVPVLSADGSTDVVAAITRSSTYLSTNTLNFSHIYSRVGTVSVSSKNGYDVSGISVSLLNTATGGKYNLSSYSWDEKNSSTVSLQVGSNDVYVVPGTYTISVTYTFTKGDYSHEFTSTGDVIFLSNKICNLAISLTGDPAVPVSFNVTMTEWATKNISFELS